MSITSHIKHWQDQYAGGSGFLRAVLVLAVCACMHVRSAAAGDALPDGAPSGAPGELVRHYHMQKVPQEGCWFTQTYASEDRLDGASLPARYAGRDHPAGNAIIALETPRDFSALHRLKTDEVWHFYEGSPLDMLLLYPDGHGEKIILGSNVLAGQLRQFTVPRGVWQGSVPQARSAHAYSLFADQLSPGFDYADFEIGYRDALQRQYPAFAREIARLTRSEFAVSRPATASSADTSDASTTPGTSADPSTQPRATVFADSAATAQTVSPGVVLQELIGAASPLAPTSRLSVARFTLAPGATTGASFNHYSQEVFVVIGGSGQVRLGSDITPVVPGSTAFIPAQETHSIEAGPAGSLVFLAISAPAFTPDDYVKVPP